MAKIGRLITAMVTPFDEKGDVDYQQAKKLARALLDSGSDALAVAATTGESPTLVREEEHRLFTEIKSVMGTKGTLIAYTGSNSTAEAVAATRDAEKIGVDAILTVVPYYNKPSQDGMYQHFKAIAASTKLPCILYNVPARTVTNLSAETVIKLSQIDNIIGIKEASNDLDQIARIISGAKKGFIIWTGNDNDVLPVLSIGGYGVISVAAHLVGRQMKKMIDSYVAGKVEEAGAIHRHLLPLFKVLFVTSNPSPVKYALNKAGFYVGKPRLPLVEPDEKSAAAISDVLKNYQIDLPLG
jgi:4-hydroxy-tetrahydrodipicolinate synthase